MNTPKVTLLLFQAPLTLLDCHRSGMASPEPIMSQIDHFLQIQELQQPHLFNVSQMSL
jgi:hypothetical protein